MASYGPVPPPGRNNPIRRPSQPSIDQSIDNLIIKNAVYYPNYRVYRGDTPASMNYNCISHVFYAFTHVATDGRIFLSDEWADAQMRVDDAVGCLGSFMRLKETHPHLKLILSVGGGAASQNFATVAATAATRDNFGRSAKGMVDASGFDGIDIDWEHPTDAEQGRDFLSLLAAVRLHLPDDGYLLSAALPAGAWALQHIDLYKAKDYLSFVNLMAYDFTGSWTNVAGHHAQLFPAVPGEPSGSAAVDYLIARGFPAKKILLGIPAYGRSFLGADGPGQAYSGHGGEEGTFEYKVLPRAGAEEIVDTRVGAAFCVGGDGGFVTYDNPETVRIKAGYCKEKGLGGLFYWTGTADAPPGPRSLILAGFKALHEG
ncbi:chitinase [Bisporella sp. PMI_857]|nr:chitinase [Bisporella sp. PMI_857]